MGKRLDRINDWPELERAVNWSVAALAKQCDVSLRTLERHFTKEFGQGRNG
jgi:transcriptional regulator GlxA family with amidase domain